MKTMKTSAALATLAACALAWPAQATNGYFTNGTSAESKGLAGAGVALETGVLGLAQNPALGTKIGNRADACLSLFAPDRSTTFGPVTYKSENPVFPIPCLGSNYALDGGTAIGILIYGNGGLNTEYSTNFLGGTPPLGVNLEQLFISPTLATDVGSGLSLGVAPVFALQRFEATGLQAFAPLSGNPAALTNNGSEWSTGFGLNLGLLWEPSAEWAIGAAYRTEIRMSPFDSYAGLFAEGGDFDIPATVTLGVAYNPAAASDWTLTAEYQRIYYGDIAAIANTSVTPGGPLGAPAGPGFGWKDMDVVRLGAEYVHDAAWTFRGGVSWASEFTDASEVLFNTLAPATPELHIGLGATYQVDENWSVTGAYVRAFENELSGVAPAGFGGAPVTIRMDQHEFTLGVNYRW